MEYIKVKDKDYLLRDSYSNGIISNDLESYQAYVESYKKIKNSNKKIKDIEESMKNMQSDLNEIKSLLVNLMKGFD
jgi:peptidoglycan hydrolase CwlO-like protein